MPPRKGGQNRRFNLAQNQRDQIQRNRHHLHEVRDELEQLEGQIRTAQRQLH